MRVNNWLSGFACVLLLGVVGCKKDKIREGIPVVVEKVGVDDVEIFGDYVGRIRARQFVEVHARVEGYLEKMLFEEGKRVERNQPLFIINPDLYKARADKAAAQLKKDEAQELKTGRDVERLRPLYEQNAASQLDLDNAIAAYESAKANVAMSKADLAQAEMELGYTTVRSPISGYICERHADIGTLVGPGSKSLLATVVASDTVLVDFSLTALDYLRSQQRNVVLHPEFVNGKYALYTRPQDGFIDTGNGGGIGWALVDDICHAEVHDEVIINKREYHTIKEVKNGEGPHPIKTEKGWLHLAHGVRCCAAGLRYVLYLYMTSLEDPTKMIAEPAGYFMAPVDEERIGDVSNVLFSNGWIADEDGKVYIYYASSDTRMHVAESTVDRLVDYCLHTPADGLRSIESVRTIIAMVDHNKKILK